MTHYAVERAPDWFLRPVITECHYLHRWPDPRSLPFGYCLRVDGETVAPDGRPFGVVVMKKPQHHKQGGLFGSKDLPTAWQVLDLARVWVHPCLQARPVSNAKGDWLYGGPKIWIGKNRKGQRVKQSENVFSRMVSLVLRRVQRDWLEHHPPVFPHLPYHIEVVLSYCDLAHHDGTGYRAANFTRWGRTQDGTKEIYVRRLACPRWQWTAPQLTFQEAL